MSSWTNFAPRTLKSWVPQLTFVRFRYFADKKRCVRRFGYENPIDQKGLLAHTGNEDSVVRQLPAYRPKDAWAEKRALFGQNDYIDILGNDNLHPTQILYDVPKWLRGVGGNEFQILLRKRKMLAHGIFPKEAPTRWKQMNSRIMKLWVYLNRKKKTRGLSTN